MITVDASKPISIGDYAWSKPFKIAKHKKRLEQILKDHPSFTAGKFFRKKSAYRYRAKNILFYCYKDQNGEAHIEECEGIENFNDGEEVTVAYGNGISEIITDFSLTKKAKKKN